jgi:DNA-binding NtrC family response regulator
MADVLLVDDDHDVAELLTDVLRAEGHEVRVAYDGREGLASIAQKAPDLVLLDVEMPVLDGPGMAWRLFVHDCGDENIPLVLSSGILDLPQVAGAVGTPYYLAKPYPVDKALDLIARALRERAPPRPQRSSE